MGLIPNQYPVGVIEMYTKQVQDLDKNISTTVHKKNFVAHPASIERYDKKILESRRLILIKGKRNSQEKIWQQISKRDK